MAQVNRTTGFFLILGVIALLGMVVGAREMTKTGDRPGLLESVPTDSSVFCSGNVDVASGLAPLIPTVPGKVKAIYVHEGDSVKAGQPLVQLDDRRQQDELRIAEQALIRVRARLEAAKQQVAEYEVKLVTQRTMLNEATEAYNAARSKWEQVRKARSNGLLTADDLDNAEHLMILAKTRMVGAKEVLQKMEGIDPKVALHEPEEELKETDMKVKAAREALDAFVIKAPSDGEIFEINYQIGGSAPLPPADANASRALLFCPNEGLIVRAEIDQESAMLVKPGMAAALKFQTSKGEYNWTGTVERVASFMTKRRSRVMEPDSFNDTRTRECIIRINQDPKYPILHGMRLSVQIYTR